MIVGPKICTVNMAEAAILGTGFPLRPAPASLSRLPFRCPVRRERNGAGPRGGVHPFPHLSTDVTYLPI